MRTIGAFLVMIFLMACSDTTKESWKPAGKVALEANAMGSTSPKKEINPFVASLEKAHKRSQVQEKEAIAFDILLYFRGKVRADATIYMLNNSAKIKMDMKDGTSILFDGKEVYLSPETSKYPKAKSRFDIFTWQYFFALPYKLSDPGTNWEMLANKTINGTSYKAGKLTFDTGTGDAPEDWYKIYQHPKTGLLDVAAYIVTYSASKEKASEDPHAIIYKDYQEVEGIPFATKWEFTGWDNEKGITEELGNAEITNIRFLTAAEADFNVPKSHVLVERGE